MAIARRTRLATAIWVVLVIVAWNLIFDRIIVLAGRGYIDAATTAAAASRPYVLINDWMRPAVRHALWTATAISGSIFIVGLAVIGLVGRRDKG